MLTIQNLNSLLKTFLTSLKNGGATFNYDLESPVKNGYMVSLLDYETKLTNFSARSLCEKIETFISFLDKTEIKLKRNSALFIGVWLDKKTDILYLDISVRKLNEWSAFELARDQKQISIYDLTNDKVIYLN